MALSQTTPRHFSLAVIASANGNEKMFRAGSTLPDGSVIREILQNTVLLEYNHTISELRIEWDTEDPAAPKGENAPLISGRPFSLRKNP